MPSLGSVAGITLASEANKDVVFATHAGVNCAAISKLAFERVWNCPAARPQRLEIRRVLRTACRLLPHCPSSESPRSTHRKACNCFKLHCCLQVAGLCFWAIVDALCTLIGVNVANPQNPSLALRDLGTLPLQQSAFHSMVDSAGVRLLNMEDILAAVRWCTRFQAHLLIHGLKAFSAAVSGMDKRADKVLAGLRTIVIGADDDVFYLFLQKQK